MPALEGHREAADRGTRVGCAGSGEANSSEAAAAKARNNAISARLGTTAAHPVGAHPTIVVAARPRCRLLSLTGACGGWWV